MFTDPDKDDLSNNPLLLTLSYTEEELMEAVKTIKCIGCEGVLSGNVYLGIYDSFDKLIETKVQPIAGEVTFSDVKDYGKLKAFIWQGANPVCENAEY